MNHKVSKRAVSLLLSAALLLSIPMAAFAATGGATMKVTYSGITLNVNGTEVTPTDAGGNIVYPFVSKGTTYLPIRAIAVALNMDITYDDVNHVVELTSNPSVTETYQPVEATVKEDKTGKTETIDITYNNLTFTINNTATEITDAKGNAVEPFLYDGSVYLPVRALATTLGKAVAYDGKTKTVYIANEKDLLPAVK